MEPIIIPEELIDSINKSTDETTNKFKATAQEVEDPKGTFDTVTEDDLKNVRTVLEAARKDEEGQALFVDLEFVEKVFEELKGRSVKVAIELFQLLALVMNNDILFENLKVISASCVKMAINQIMDFTKNQK